eukprot:UN00311
MKEFSRIFKSHQTVTSPLKFAACQSILSRSHD